MSTRAYTAASKLTPEAFELEFPFVQVRSLDLLPDSLFANRTVDNKVLKTVLFQEVLPELKKWTDIFRTGQESHNRPILNSLLPALKALSVDITDMVFDDTPYDADSSDSAGSSRGLMYMNEDSTDLPPRQTADIVGYVVDKQLYEDTGHLEDLSLVCKLVIEEKTALLQNWNRGPGGCFQLAAYMVHHGLSDFQKGRRSPIYGIGLTMNLWTGAELRIDGVVTITHGQASFSDYITEAAQQRVTSQLSKKQVQDGQYVVARCYIGRVSQTSFSWFPPTPPVFHLIECLLKICVGSRVHEWTAETVKDKLIAYRQQLYNSVSTFEGL